MIDLCDQLRLELMQNGVRGNRFGTTSEDVFNLAQLMTAISATFSKSDIKEIQNLLNIHVKVWSKFRSIMKDSRIKMLRESNCNLPTSYTALYALVVMNDDEFESYLRENVLEETTSSHFILTWTKNYRALCQLV